MIIKNTFYHFSFIAEAHHSRRHSLVSIGLCYTSSTRTFQIPVTTS